jgi:hypothetical protein
MPVSPINHKENAMFNRRNKPKKRIMKRKIVTPKYKPAMPTKKEAIPMLEIDEEQLSRGYVAIEGVGSVKAGGRFVRMKVNGKKFLFSTNDLLGNMNPVFARLQKYGAVLIDRKDQNELRTRIKAALQEEDVFPVAKRLGWHRDEDAQGKKGPPVFVLPHGAIPEGVSPVEVHLDEADNDCYQRLECKGDLAGATEWLKLCDGNSRAMFGLSLACLGPVGSFIGLEHVGIALVGDAGKLKTVLASVIASFYGGDDDPLNDLASGASMAQTDFNGEKVAKGRNGLISVLDEADNIEGADAKAKANAVLNLIKKVAQKRSKGRGNDPHIYLFYAPLVITTNESVASYTRKRGRRGDLSYVDRCFDIGPPAGSGYFFENLHGSNDATAFRDRIIPLIHAHYGVPGWEFIRRLAKGIGKDEAGFRKFVKARIDGYRGLAKKIPTPGREQGRLHNKFAFVYAAGCVGIKLGILPFKRADLLKAILSCQRDHIAYVAQELGLRGSAEPAEGDPLESDIRKIGRHLRRNRSMMIDMRRPGAQVPRGHLHRDCVGYLGRKGDRNEMWVPFLRVSRLLNSDRTRVRAVQDELHRLGLLWADESPSGHREYSVKREIKGVKRGRVLAFRYAPKKAAKL